MRAALVLALLLAGCASQPPQAWMLYSRASYLYGRIEAKAEDACGGKTIPERFAAACAEAAAVQKEVKTINPVIQAELAKKEPDWTRIFQYVDLIIGVASKFLVVP